MRLLLTEIRRFAARRLVRMMVLASVLGIALAGAIVLANHHRLTSDEADQVRLQRDAQIRACRSGEFGPPPPGVSKEEFCREISGDLTFGVSDPRFHLEALPDVFRGTSAPLVVVAFVLGASFVGAEWHAGTMALLLTWESRRWRVFVAKAVAAVVITFAGTIAILVLLGLALTPAAVASGTIGEASASWVRETAGVLVRGGLLSAVGAAAGFAVASAARNTAAALGVGFGYMVVVESLLSGLRPGWRPWMVVPNAVALLVGNDAIPGVHRTALEAGILLSAYGAAALVVAGVLFARRDVT
jgi:ABC-2 type transport system permease protein